MFIRSVSHPTGGGRGYTASGPSLFGQESYNNRMAVTRQGCEVVFTLDSCRLFQLETRHTASKLWIRLTLVTVFMLAACLITDSETPTPSRLWIMAFHNLIIELLEELFSWPTQNRLWVMWNKSYDRGGFTKYVILLLISITSSLYSILTFRRLSTPK